MMPQGGERCSPTKVMQMPPCNVGTAALGNVGTAALGDVGTAALGCPAERSSAAPGEAPSPTLGMNENRTAPVMKLN